MNYIETLGAKAKASEKALRCASTELKNKALAAIAKALCDNVKGFFVKCFAIIVFKC